MNFVEKLQNKSRFIRIQILWTLVILVMIIIISIWLVYLKSSLQSPGPNQEAQSQEQRQSIPSLFGTIKEDFSILKKSLQAGVMKIVGGSEKEEEIEFEAEIK